MGHASAEIHQEKESEKTIRNEKKDNHRCHRYQKINGFYENFLPIKVKI